MSLALVPTATVRAGTVTVLFEEVGPDVRATLSGSFGLGGLDFLYDEFSDNVYVDPSFGEYFSLTFTEFFVDNVSRYRADPVTGPSTFGSGSLSYPSNWTGDPFGFRVQPGEEGNYAFVYLPIGYAENQALSGINTWNDATLVSLGITPGTYTWDLGGGDSFVIQAVGVPEPSTYVMALAGVACGGYSMWRRRKRA